MKSRHAVIPGIGALALAALFAILAAVSGPTAAHASAVRPAAAAAAPSTPDPRAPHTQKVIPGVSGAAAVAKVIPANVQTRFADIHQDAVRMARQAKSPSAPSPSSTVRPNDIAPWSGSIHNYWGTIGPSSGVIGAQATQSLNPPLSAWDGDTVYAPTLFPASITTIEMTTVEWSNGTWVAAWDWGDDQPGFYKMVSTDDLADYITVLNGQRYYSVQDVQTNPVTNNWTSYLYNYTTQTWDPFYSSANANKLSVTGNGWDMFEIYTDYNPATGVGYYCSDTYSYNWNSRGLQYLTSGKNWVEATPRNSTIQSNSTVFSTDFGCYSLSFSVVKPNSYWQVIN